MTLRLWNPSILAMTIVGGALAAVGCGQADSPATSPGVEETAVEEALTAVQDCQAEARSCVPDAIGVTATCDEQLHACLSNAAAAKHPQGDAAVVHPRDDAAPEEEDDHDGGRIHEAGDSGVHPRPEQADGAVAPPKPAATDGGSSLGASVGSCIEALKTCLATDEPARRCAAGVVACLSALHQARK